MAPTCSIIDVGGDPHYWLMCGPDLLADPRISITLVNLRFDDIPMQGLSPEQRARFTMREADARAMPEIVDGAYDIAHSNSTIEHVGRWQDMRAMAREMQRIGRTHYVQTPYMWFPVDPHNQALFFHWLPEQMRYRIMLKRSLGYWPQAQSVDGAVAQVQSNVLLDRTQLAALFPNSTIHSEIVMGLVKSLVAVGGEGMEVDARSNTRALRI